MDHDEQDLVRLLIVLGGSLFLLRSWESYFHWKEVSEVLQDLFEFALHYRYAGWNKIATSAPLAGFVS